ncbi:unnamed protein product [Ixodes persulcatus]
MPCPNWPSRVVGLCSHPSKQGSCDVPEAGVLTGVEILHVRVGPRARRKHRRARRDMLCGDWWGIP